MQFDYCELELDEDSECLHIVVGCKFVDEPDELYVIRTTGHQNGHITELQLFFNGMDCKYTFQVAEAAAVLDYIQSGVSSTVYADWFKGSLSLSHGEGGLK